jgi:hypothetical protein
VDLARSLVDDRGNVVQPYGRYDDPHPGPIGDERRYQVELWPIGNQFEPGHRLRLHVIGVSGASQPSAPAVNTIRLGPGASRLLFPVLPGSDLGGALVPEAEPRAAGAGRPSPALPATGDEEAPLRMVAVLLVGLAAGLRRLTVHGAEQRRAGPRTAARG